MNQQSIDIKDVLKEYFTLQVHIENLHVDLAAAEARQAQLMQVLKVGMGNAKEDDVKQS